MIEKRCIHLLLIISIALFSCKDNSEAYRGVYLSAQKLASGGEIQKAIELIESDIPIRDRKYAYYFLHGVYLRTQDSGANAQSILSDFLKAYSYNKKLYDINLLLGVSYSRLKMHKEAVRFLNEALALFNPEKDKFPPYADLVIEYENLGKYQEALGFIEKAILSDPDETMYIMNKGVILAKMGDLNSIAKYYDIANKRKKDDIGVQRYYLEELVDFEILPEAYKFIEMNKDRSQNYYWCYSELGYLNMVRGDVKNSYDNLNKALFINSNDLNALKYLVFYYYLLNDYDNCFKVFTKYRSLNERGILVHKPDDIGIVISYFKDDNRFKNLTSSMDKVPK